MKSRPGQGLTEISKKIRHKQNDHASRRTQRYPHTRREQHRPSPNPTPAPIKTAPPQPIPPSPTPTPPPIKTAPPKLMPPRPSGRSRPPLARLRQPDQRNNHNENHPRQP